MCEHLEEHCDVAALAELVAAATDEELLIQAWRAEQLGRLVCRVP